MENKGEKAKEPDAVIENSGKEFKAVKYNDYKENQKKEKLNFSFIKTIGVPFLCGVLGAGVVLGTCFGIPSIRSKIIGNQTSSISSSHNDSTQSSGYVQQTSLSNYSDTAVYAANKILPSIVGIKIEYNINTNYFEEDNIIRLTYGLADEKKVIEITRKEEK